VKIDNMTFQDIFEISTAGRGTSEITAEVTRIVRAAKIERGIAHVFAQHTSCSVIITENADPTVRNDLEMLAQRWAPDGDAEYHHDTEGDDDMAAHARSLLAGISVTVPIANGKLLLGTWQGIYLWEHRTHAHNRRIVVTVTG
jgi:secondary thiamine-phosphate synthase enzyme